MTVDLEEQDTSAPSPFAEHYSSTSPGAQRWTLGPTWYEQNADLFDDLLPYYEHGSAPIDSSETLDRARRWATDIIQATSDMIVTNWQEDGVTPYLSVTTHIMVVDTDGQSLRFEINGAYRAIIEDTLADPDAVFRLPADGNTNINTDPTGTEEFTYIPARSIRSLRVISKNSEAFNV